MVPLPRRRFLKLAAGLPFVSLATRAWARPEGVDAFGAHRATRNTALGSFNARPLLWAKPLPYKRYAGFEREPLAKVGLESRPLASVVPAFTPASAFERASISRDQLSGLLLFTNGVTGQVVGRDPPVYRRAAPSAGALYAGEVYVLAQRVEGLVPGLYAFQPREHALVKLRTGRMLGRVAATLEFPGAVENAAAAVLLTNVFYRYKWKYRERGYRYALLDSGHIAENLRLAAAGAGLGVASPLRFHDDALNGLLGQDGRREAICALLALGRPSEWDDGGPGPRLVEKQQAEPPAWDSLDRVERYHEGTKLVPRESTKLVPLAGQEPAPPPPPAPPVDGEPTLALPELEVAPERLVTECISARRSAMRFSRGRLALWELAFVLEMARGAPVLASDELELLAVVHRVEGAPAGLYRYHPGSHGLEELRSADLRGPLRRACLGQPKAATAAVAFLVVGDVARARERAGDRSYRDLLLGAGAMAQRIYLGAEAIDLGARNLAAFFDDPLNDLVGLDGRERAVVHLTVLGREPSPVGDG
ncbi:MAG: SagB/ThcOx family dehydrogenase [Myxococcota bacterium]